MKRIIFSAILGLSVSGGAFAQDTDEGPINFRSTDGRYDLQITKVPDDLPSPHIKFRKGANGAVKNYGGGVRPIRWLKSGKLALSSEEVMLSRVDDMTYTGTIVITIGFDAEHRAAVKKVSKTKTRVE